MTTENTAIALGFFDGVHRGHRAVLARTVELGAAQGLVPCAFTFTMRGGGPAAKAGAGAIMTPAAREETLRAFGMERVFCPEFSEFCELDGEAFFKTLLLESFGARALCCGTDFRFGRGAQCTADDLAALCAEHGVRLSVVPPVLEDGAPVSSTRIRALLAKGDMAEAAALLGRPYGFSLPVQRGRQLGRTLDFPTLNQPFPAGLALPRFGVYAAFAHPDGVWRPAVTNVGVKPTVEQGAAPLAETYVFGAAGDWYGQSVPVRLAKFLRPEERFSSTQELRAAIEQDCKRAADVCEAARWARE